MKVSKIHLFDMNTYQLLNHNLPFNGNNGLLWFQRALLEKGIKSEISPTYEKPESLNEIVNHSIEKYRYGDNLAIICFSCSDHLVEHAIELSKKINESGSRIITVAGGPTFIDHQYCLDSVSKYNFHAVIRGGCMPAVELIADIYSGKYEITNLYMPLKAYNLPDGLYAIKREGPAGKGIGKHPRFNEEVPLSVSISWEREKLMIIGLPVKGSCPNKCGYCASMNIPFQGNNALINGLRSALENNRTYFEYDLRLDGNSPLSSSNIDTNLELLSHADRLKPYARAYSYIDPAHLLDKEHFKKILQAIVHYRIRDIKFGFDSPTEDISKKIGRNFLGKTRGQQKLDNEISMSIRLLNCAASEIKKNDRIPLKVRFHYIISPFDDLHSITKGLNNLFRLGENTINEFVEPEFVYWPLWPLSGTWVKKRYRNISMPTPPIRTWNWKYSNLSEFNIYSIKGIGAYNSKQQFLTKHEFYFAKIASLSYVLGAFEGVPVPEIGFKYIPEIRNKLLNKDTLIAVYKDFRLLIDNYKGFVEKSYKISEPETALEYVFLSFFKATNAKK